VAKRCLHRRGERSQAKAADFASAALRFATTFFAAREDYVDLLAAIHELRGTLLALQDARGQRARALTRRAS